MPGADTRGQVDPADLALILRETPAAVWEKLRGKRLFITGGTGFIGCWLLEGLLWANQALSLDMHLTVLSRKPRAFQQKAPHLAADRALALVEGNVTSLGHIEGSFDLAIHAATDVADVNPDRLQVFHDIVEGTRQVFESSRRWGVRRCLLLSSGAVYGNQPVDLSHMPESFGGAPDTSSLHSAYGHGKRVSEWLAHAYGERDGTETVIARCFALLGPYLPLSAQFAAGNFIADVAANRIISIAGDGTPRRSYLYAADMVVWLLTMLAQGESGATYNLGSEKDLSILQLAELTSTTLDHAPPIDLAVLADPARRAARYVPSTWKARHELGLNEYTDLPTAIRRTAIWARAHAA